MILVCCMSSHDALYLCEISWKYLVRFSTYKADMSTWWKWISSTFKRNNSKNRQTRVTVHVFCTSSHDALYLCEISWKYLVRFSTYKADMSTWWKWLNSTFKGNNSKNRQTRVTFMCSACRLMVLYICMKFCENITSGIRVMERTKVHGRNGYIQCSKGNNSRVSKPELWFMCSAHCLMVLYILMWSFMKISQMVWSGHKIMKRWQTDKHSKFRRVYTIT